MLDRRERAMRNEEGEEVRWSWKWGKDVYLYVNNIIGRKWGRKKKLISPSKWKEPKKCIIYGWKDEWTHGWSGCYTEWINVLQKIFFWLNFKFSLRFMKLFNNFLESQHFHENQFYWFWCCFFFLGRIFVIFINLGMFVNFNACLTWLKHKKWVVLRVMRDALNWI